MDYAGYTGLPLNEAKAKAVEQGMTFRIMREDGQSFVGTCEYDLGRINFAVDKGLVTEVWIG